MRSHFQTRDYFRYAAVFNDNAILKSKKPARRAGFLLRRSARGGQRRFFFGRSQP
jgi:hypothetical protein